MKRAANAAGITTQAILLVWVAFGASSAADRDLAPLYSSHRDEAGFFNPWSRFVRPSIWNMIQWKSVENPYDKQPAPVIPKLENDGAYLSGVEHSATVTWVGHATFAVHDRGDVFLTDPHFSKRALIPARAVPPTPSPSSPTITTTSSTRAA